MQRFYKRACKARTAQLLILTILLTPGLAAAGELAVVIDDVGYSKTRGMRAIDLPGEVTVAMLPFAPHTQSLAQYAITRGKEVIVHQPMEPEASPKVRNEQGTLTLAMPSQEFTNTLAAALDAIPARVGVSNHTGSLLTQHPVPMQHLMRQINARDLYFLDSRTTAATVALSIAREHGVPAIKRDVFLDNQRTRADIHLTFERALNIARRNGHAVAIGHPYRVTLEYLEERLKNLPDDVRLVSAGELARRSPGVKRPAMLAQPPSLNALHISPGR